MFWVFRCLISVFGKLRNSGLVMMSKPQTWCRSELCFVLYCMMWHCWPAQGWWRSWRRVLWWLQVQWASERNSCKLFCICHWIWQLAFAIHPDRMLFQAEGREGSRTSFSLGSILASKVVAISSRVLLMTNVYNGSQNHSCTRSLWLALNHHISQAHITVVLYLPVWLFHTISKLWAVSFADEPLQFLSLGANQGNRRSDPWYQCQLFFGYFCVWFKCHVCNPVRLAFEAEEGQAVCRCKVTDQHIALLRTWKHTEMFQGGNFWGMRWCDVFSCHVSRSC